MKLIVYTDGASRGNPGHAAIGFVILRDNSILESGGEYIGLATNNEAEYTALIKALTKCIHYGATDVSCFSDSKLMISQLRGEWRVKSPDIKVLFNKVKLLEKELKSVEYTHVRRSNEWISKCDFLANQALNSKGY